MRMFVFTLIGIGLWFCGCAEKPQPTSDSAQAMQAKEPQIPAKPNAKLRTVRLWLGSEEMTAELALSPIEVQTGMMYRTNIAENEGMLFIFPYPDWRAFWMKNTSVPLSAAYIDPEGVILEIHDLQPHNTNSVVSTSAQVQFVLETPQGWFQRHKVSTGMFVKTSQGPLSLLTSTAR